MNSKKGLLVLVVLLQLLTARSSFAQTSQPTPARQYQDAKDLGVHGLSPHDGAFYHRIDTVHFGDLPDNPKLFYTHSAGVYVTFRTNSKSIYAKWCTSPAKAYSNLTAIAFEGLDLYIRRNGQWVHAGVGRPGAKECSEATLVTGMDTTWKECLLYLPLYDSVSELEIGVDSLASLEGIDSPFEYNIPVYGTSIVHGASASRPGLAYPARLSRMTGLDFINMGISGSAKMEPEVARMIADMQLDALIIDCVPNCSPDNILERTAPFILRIREQHPDIPIIAIEGAIFESGNFNQGIASDIRLRNQRFREEINKLQQADAHLYLLSADGLMGDDHEGTIDGTHPNDLGFDRMIRKILPFTKNILQRYNML